MTRLVGYYGRRWCLIGGMSLLALMTSCGRKSPPSIPEDLARRCVVIENEEASSQPSSWSAWIHQFMPSAPRFPAEQLEQAITTCLESDRTLILAHPLTSSNDLYRIDDYLRRGGRILLLGREHAPPADGLETLKPAVIIGPMLFSITTDVFHVVSSNATTQIESRRVLSPAPAPRGYGGERASGARWIPVIEAMDAHGRAIGWPGSVWITPQAEAGHSVCGWLGLNPGRDDAPKLVPLVTAMIQESARPVYLHRYGLDRHSARSQTPLQVSARIIDRRDRDLSALRLVVEWVNRHGQEIRRHVSPPLDNPGVATTLNIGLAPEPASGQPEAYRVRLLVRDRNDQQTYDTAEHMIKVFPRDYRPTLPEPITTQAGQLVQGRRPVFMLGVNYWPRGLASLRPSQEIGHWLDPERFDAALVTSDLDLMAAAGINSIAVEYTDFGQAPQLIFVLEELRRRSMWAHVYMPTLHPLDLRLEEAMKLLAAAEIKNWPEWYAIEIARGLIIKPRAERRRLDQAWADWLDEHFNSAAEAEQKLGVTLWRERGRIAGPPDAQLKLGPHRDRSIALYYVFLRDYACRRMGYTRQTLRNEGYQALLTARSAYGWPTDDPTDAPLDVLDVSTGSLHQDFLSLDAWTIHPLRNMYSDGDRMIAYARGVGAGKPVVWAAYGQHVSSTPTPQTHQRQKEVYKHFLDMFTRQGSSGAYAWWYPAGPATINQEDWGLVLPSGSWRPVEEVFRAIRLRLRQTRLHPPTPVRESAPLIQSASQWRQEQSSRQGLFADQPNVTNVTEWTMPGVGLDSTSILDPRQMQRWSEIDGLHLLNAEWGEIHVAEARHIRAPGENIRTYAGRGLQLELINSGAVRWIGRVDQRPGSISLRISQPGHTDEWIAAASVDRGGRQIVRWTPREPGLWEIQPYLAGYGKFGERLRIEVTTPPSLF